MAFKNSSWIAWPINNGPITAFIVSLLLIFGLYAIKVMPKDEFPAFTVRQGVVVAVVPGATAEEVEEQVARPLERYVATYKEVDRSRTYTTSSNGMCMMMVQFHDSENDMTAIWSKMKHGITAFKAQLPQSVLAIVVQDDFGDSSALLITIESNQRSYRELQGYSDELADRLRRIASVSNVRQYGEQKEQLTVTVDKQRLAAYGIGQAMLMQTLSSEGLTTLSGAISTTGNNMNIHVAASQDSEKELLDRIIYSGSDGKSVRVRDIATVTREYDTSGGYIESNGKRSVLLSLEMVKGNNIVQYGRDVDEVLASFKDEVLPSDVDMRRITDQPQVVGLSVSDFLRDLVISMAIIIVVMMMLFPLRSALVAALTVPLTTFIATGIMYMAGIELNIISLASLIVVLGMIVDNAIVVIDGYLEYRGKGQKPIEAAVESVRQYFWPMLLATLCLCVIFYPLLFTMTGEARDAIGLFPVTMSINLLLSLAIAAVVIPLLCSVIIKKIKVKKANKRDVTDYVQDIYEKILRWCFNHSAVTIIGAIVLTLSTLSIFLFLKIRQFPFADRNQFAVEIYLPEGSGIDETVVVADSLRSVLEKDDRITGITTFIGCSSPRFHSSYAPPMAGPNFAQFIVNTKGNDITLDLLDEYAPQYSNHWPNAYVKFKQMDYLFVPTYEYRFYGNNMDSLQAAASMLMTEMRSYPELEWVHTNFDNLAPVMEVSLDQVAASQLGINRTAAELQLMMQTGKLKVSSVWEESEAGQGRTYEVPIVLKDKNADNMQFDDVENVYLTSISGQSVPLRQVAETKPVWHQQHIVHRNGERCISVLAEGKRGVFAQAVQNRIADYLTTMDLPQGIRSEIGGEPEQNDRMTPQIFAGVAIAMLFIFFFLLFNFRSFSMATICIMAMGLGMPGAMIGLLIANKVLGLTSMFGFITLMGMVMRNEILIFEHANDKMKQGYSAREAAYDAGRRRMVPIFLTTATTAVGVVPMIIAGNSFWMPVGITIFGGGIGMLILVTTVLPVVYWKVYERKNK